MKSSTHRTALISVFDKTGIVEFSKGLVELGFTLVSSGGTAKLLSSSGISVKEVSSVTGFPEMMEGRVKTLHPKIHGGILADRSKKSHLEDAKKNGIELIDLVVVNLYPFESTISKPNVSLEEVIENIDIGGPTLIRSAAKNYAHVGVVTSSSQYEKVLAELKEGALTKKTKERLAVDAFEHVAHYDVIIEKELRKRFSVEGTPQYLNLSYVKKEDLRYGENPHQSASVYTENNFSVTAAINAKQLQGKQMSYNNYLDANAALELLKEFDEPTAVVVKHNNPSGVASDSNILSAYKKARAVDPEAAFGGIVVVNREVDKLLAEEIISKFVEIVMAPSFSKEALEVFVPKKNVRVLELGEIKRAKVKKVDYRSINGGILMQDRDTEVYSELKTITKRQPSKQEMEDLVYAWKIAKHVKSNAIVLAKNHQAIGIGAGQMKRIDAEKLAGWVAKDYSGPESLKGCVMASDAFFPFRDGIDYAAKLGVVAIIQPGGSIKDEEVIKAADEHGIAMVFTGMRHFRH